MNNKNKIILGSIIGIMIGLLISTTYAIFSYNKIGANNQLIAGDIYMHYNETNTLTLENAMPSSTYDETKYFEFTIKGKNTNTKYNIVYDINLNYGDEIENKIRIQDRFLKFRLVEVVNNEEQELLNDKSYLSIDNKRIYVSTINKNTNTEIMRVYRLYVWIDKNVVIGNTDYSDYSITDWNNVYGSVKVSVTGDFFEKEVQTEPYLVMKNIYNDTNWKNIRANITSVEFHTDGIIPTDAITSLDVTDETSSGEVTLYTIDDGLGNNTYKAVVVGDDVIYAPENSQQLFFAMINLVTFNSKNFKVDNVTNMTAFFVNDYQLINIDSLSNWNTLNVTNMASMFQQCTNLTNISSLSTWNTSNVTNMRSLFQQCSNLTNVDGLINWNVSNVTNMNRLFYNCTNLQDINGLKNWNVSNVSNMAVLFASCTNLKDISAISNWNVSNVTYFDSAFAGCTNLTNISGLSNWNVSSVTIMYSMFYNCANLTDIGALSNWATKTGKVENMSYMFGMGPSMSKTNDPVIDFSALANWNVSNVTNMEAMFQNVNILSYQAFANWNVGKVNNFYSTFNQTSASTVTTLEGLENWNVSSATNMNSMFSDNVSLTDASAINNWNIKSSIDFTGMFSSDPVHPEFTKVSGTWDSNGTFTPTV